MTLILMFVSKRSLRLHVICQDAPGHLCEDLDERGVHESRSPDWDGEHNAPSRSCDCALSIDGELDFVELGLDPFVVVAVVVEFF